MFNKKNQTFTDKNFTINKNGELLSYLGNESSVTIPDFVQGISVLYIGRNCFYQNTSLEKISFPKHLKKIKPGAFNGCHKLSFASFSRCKTMPIVCDPIFEKDISCFTCEF